MKKQTILGSIIFITMTIIGLTSMPLIVEGKGGPLPTIIYEDKIKLIPLTNTGYENLTYLLSSNPKLHAFIDFKNVRNESLPRILKRTSYSLGVTIPSNNVYVKEGELYVSNVNHLIIEEKVFKTLGIESLNLNDNILVVAYVRMISGKDYGYARGGIGFYGKTMLSQSEKYYMGTGYWLSVLGSFTGRKLSYDFEGHWSKLHGRWLSSTTYRRFIYDYNKTYMLWIAKTGRYIVGGIIDGTENSISADKILSTIKSYIEEENVYKIDITAYKSKIAIRRIEIYKLEPGKNLNNITVKLIEPVIYSSRYALLQPRKNKILEFMFTRHGRTIEFEVNVRNK